jgi:4-amino-4-deoxy-L-arabinose transferase-like glycosyltransferase
VLQALAHIATAIGAASIAFSVFKNRATAIITLFGMVIYPSLLAYQCLLLTETLFTCFLVLGFAFLYAWEPGHPGIFVLSGLFFMLSLYTRPVITILMPLLFLARGFAIFDNPWQRLRYCLYSCLVFLVCIAPWWIRNWNVFGEFVPFTTSASMNLYLGNNRGNLTGGVEWSTDAPPEEVAELMSAGSETDISRAFTAKSISYIRENKAVFLANVWKKFKRFWNFTLNTDSAKLPKYFQYYNIASILSWGPAFFLALATLWRKRKEWFILLPLFLLVGYYVFVHVVTIASLRYRLPIEPFFVILGADSLRVILERSGIGIICAKL